jgi:hypothetical protein
MFNMLERIPGYGDIPGDISKRYFQVIISGLELKGWKL